MRSRCRRCWQPTRRRCGRRCDRRRNGSRHRQIARSELGGRVLVAHEQQHDRRDDDDRCRQPCRRAALPHRTQFALPRRGRRRGWWRGSLLGLGGLRGCGPGRLGRRGLLLRISLHTRHRRDARKGLVEVGQHVGDGRIGCGRRSGRRRFGTLRGDSFGGVRRRLGRCRLFGLGLGRRGRRVRGAVIALGCGIGVVGRRRSDARRGPDRHGRCKQRFVDHVAQLGHALRPVLRRFGKAGIERAQPWRLRHCRVRRASPGNFRAPCRLCRGEPGRGRRQFAVDAKVQRRRQRVEVGPRPRSLSGRRVAQLGRGKARFERSHHVLRSPADQLGAHGVEAEQQQVPVVAHKDAAGRERAMHPAFGVQHREGAEQILEPALQRRRIRRFGERAAMRQQRRPGAQAHRAVHGAVALEHAVDAQQRRMLAACQRLRLADEGLTPLLERMALDARAQHDAAVGAAQRHRLGHVLLYRDLHSERVIERAIDDRNAALDESLFDLVIVDPRAGRKGPIGCRGGGRPVRRLRHLAIGMWHGRRIIPLCAPLCAKCWSRATHRRACACASDRLS